MAILRITEIVTAPLADWSDAAGVPFDSTPGAGVVDTTDEFIEIKNVGSAAASLIGLQLTMTDSVPSTYVINSLVGGTLESYSLGASAALFPPGAVLVIGNPPDVLDDDVFIELEVVPSGPTINDVEVGDVAGQPGTGAPEAGMNGASTMASDEAIQRVNFVGLDDVDFDKGPADPGL